jgi:hypothetical protein
MKTIIRILSAFTISLFLLHTSCREEESEFLVASPGESLEANSAIANLLQSTSMNDGSDDNIIDGSSCFNIELPVTVNVNGLEIIVDSREDFQTIEDIFDEFDDDDDFLEIEFPIIITLSDFTKVTINNFDEFEDFADDCNGDNMDDDDIECVDIKYPITASIFNSKNELISTVTISNDKELYIFIEDLDEDLIVNVSFPITAILSDGTELQVSDLDELEVIINNAKDDCDEDDDNDFDDDDCENCTTNQLSDILLECSDWTVDKLERNDDNDLEDQYAGFRFNFMADGILTVESNEDSFSGTWESSGDGNNIKVKINVPGLADFNETWNLHEIQQRGDENKVDLRLGDDRLRFENDCN